MTKSTTTPEPNPDSYLGKLNQDPKFRKLVDEERDKLVSVSATDISVLNICVDDLNKFVASYGEGKLNVVVHYIDKRGDIVRWNPANPQPI